MPSAVPALPASHQQPEALGSEPHEDPRTCMFCGNPIVDRGAAYMDHLRASPDCGTAYEAWLERLDEDRAGG